ncbi:hypothetical protein GLOTRDRAFT_15759, partial [Gloeophyllum trabeum ATCC 11539]
MSEAKRLHHSIFDGRQVLVQCQSPKRRQTSSFSIEIKGLPPNVRAEDIQRWCNAASVTLGRASYGRSTGIQHVRDELSKFGPLESFDLVPSGPRPTKLKAFGQFCTPEAAAAAAEKLNNTPQKMLGSPLWSELIYSLKYLPPWKQFMALRDDLVALSDQHADCKIRYYEADNEGRAVDPVCIRIYSSDAKALGRAKIAVETMLQGEVLASDGKSVWDDFFLSSEGTEFL